MLSLLPAGIIVLPETGIQKNLANKPRKMGPGSRMLHANINGSFLSQSVIRRRAPIRSRNAGSWLTTRIAPP